MSAKKKRAPAHRCVQMLKDRIHAVATMDSKVQTVIRVSCVLNLGDFDIDMAIIAIR